MWAAGQVVQAMSQKCPLATITRLELAETPRTSTVILTEQLAAVRAIQNDGVDITPGSQVRAGAPVLDEPGSTLWPDDGEVPSQASS